MISLGALQKALKAVTHLLPKRVQRLMPTVLGALPLVSRLFGCYTNIANKLRILLIIWLHRLQIRLERDAGDRGDYSLFTQESCSMVKASVSVFTVSS